MYHRNSRAVIRAVFLEALLPSPLRCELARIWAWKAMRGRRLRRLAPCDVGSALAWSVRRSLSGRSVAQRSETRANLFRKELRLFKGRKVPTLGKLVEVNEF